MKGYNYEDYGGIVAYQGGARCGRVVKCDAMGCILDTGAHFDPTYVDAKLVMPLLYKKSSSGNIMVMEIWTIDGDTIKSTIKEKGKAKRAYSSPVKVPPSKTQKQRCVEQLISKWNKKSGRDGWTPEEGGEEPMFFEPMLLHRWDKYYKRLKKWPLIMQPKLNGVRAVHYPEHKAIVSRKREPFHLPHIVEQMGQLGVSGDGELFHKQHLLEDIMGAAMRQEETVPDSPLNKGDLEYHLFDRWDKSDWPYADRYASLFDLDLSQTPHIKIVPAIIVHSVEEADKFLKAMTGQGYEGAVACDTTERYEKNKRVYHRLKMKPLFDDEFKILSVTYDPDSKLGNLLSFICEAKNGQSFKVTPSWPKERRAQEYQFGKREQYVGQMLTVEYRELTKNGIPRHAVGKYIRPKEI